VYTFFPLVKWQSTSLQQMRKNEAPCSVQYLQIRCPENKRRMRQTWKTNNKRSRYPKTLQSVTLITCSSLLFVKLSRCAFYRNQNTVTSPVHKNCHIQKLIYHVWYCSNYTIWRVDNTVHALKRITRMVSVKQCTYSRRRLGMLPNSMSGMWRSRLLFKRLKKKETPGIIN
jgi:hypothetical protein